MPRPSLTVLPRGQKSVDYFLECARGRIGHKAVQLVKGRRQPRQVEAHPAEERRFVRNGTGLDPDGFEIRENESVDGGLRPQAVFDRRDWCAVNWAESPVVMGGTRGRCRSGRGG
jgi:hypothetical protein